MFQSYMVKIVIPKRSAIILAGDLGMFKTIKSKSQLLICHPYSRLDAFERPYMINGFNENFREASRTDEKIFLDSRQSVGGGITFLPVSTFPS